MNERAKRIIKRTIFSTEAPHWWLNYLYRPLRKRGLIADKPYLKNLYRCQMGEKLDLRNPHTFNQKIQWLKLYDHNPLYTTMVDKYAMKQYVSDIIGPEYVVPLLGVWDKPEDIDWDALPEKFVLKTTYGGGGSVIICKDKNKFDKEAAVAKLRRLMKTDIYNLLCEWPYKNVPKRIIAEQFLETSEDCLKDFKFYMFDGVCKALFIASDRASGETKADYFDASFKKLNFTWGYPHAEVSPQKPESFDEMVQLAEKLSKGLPHVRVDFYEVNGKAYFGELTFYDASGFAKFDPKEWDEIFDEWITVPDKLGGGNILIVNNIVLYLHSRRANDAIMDYKFFCFNGTPKLMYISNDASQHARTDFYDMDFCHLPIHIKDPNSETPPSMPKEFELMKSLASKLSQNLRHVRVDFYYIDGKVYFGELTLYHNSGLVSIHPKEWADKMGEWIDLTT